MNNEHTLRDYETLSMAFERMDPMSFGGTANRKETSHTSKTSSREHYLQQKR